MTSPLDVRDADRWWSDLPPARRVSIWRWVTRTPGDPAPDPSQIELFTPEPAERTGADQKAS